MAAGDVITIVEDNMAKKGCYFDGTDDYILVDAHAVERVAAADATGTYTAWVNIDTLEDSDYVFLSVGDNDSGTEYLIFYLASVGDKPIATLYFGGATKWTATGTVNSVSKNTWMHLALVQNGTAPKIYVNGTLVATGTGTDTTCWFNTLVNCDKFAIGVKESNGTHTYDFPGMIGNVKYWSRALSAAEVLKDCNGESVSTAEFPDSTYLRLNITMNDDGTTDSGAGADNGTLTGHAHYGGYISAHSKALERNCSGHAAERSTTFQVSPNKLCSIIVRGD